MNQKNTINKGFLTGFKNKKLTIFFAVAIVLMIGFGITIATGGFGFLGVSAPSHSAGSTSNALVGYWTLNENDLTEGADLVTNGGFVSDISGWSNSNLDTFEWDAGELHIAESGSNWASAWQDVGLVVGKTYFYSFDATKNSTTDLKFQQGENTIIADITSSGTHSGTFVCSSADIIRFKVSSTDGNFDWNFDNVVIKEIDASIKDKSGNGNDGAIAVTPATFVADQNGVPNQAMTFNGSSDYVNLGSLETLTNNFTFKLDIKPIDIPAGGSYIITNTAGAVSGFGIFIFDNYNLGIQSNGNGGSLATNITLTNSVWYSLIVTYDGSNYKVYIDGVNAKTINQVGSINQIGSNYNIGYRELSSDFYYSGYVSDVAIYSSTLTSDQVSQLYKAGRTTAKVKVDATNPHKITPKLQKGLILDMPLSEPYTEAGSDILSGWDFTSGWSVYEATVVDNNSFTSTGAASGGVNKAILELGKRYTMHIAGSTAASSFSVLCTGAGAVQYSPTMSGSFDETFTFTAQNNNAVYLRNANAATTDITTFTVVELDGTTKDRTPNGNDGTVSGATIKYDGLINTGAGIAYINSDTAYGTWEFDFNKGGAGNDLQIGFINDNIEIGDYGEYRLDFNEDESIGFYKSGAAILFTTAASYISINTDYRIKVTRSLAGVFTVYIKGGSFGWDDWTTVVASTGTNPVTDTTYTTSSYFVADLDNGDTISNLKIDGKRISLAKATQSTGTWTTTGASYDFTTDDYIDCGNDASLDVGTENFTVAVWVKKGATNPNNSGIISTFTSVGWFLEVPNADSSTLRLLAKSSTSDYWDKTITNVLTTDTWVHLAVVMDRSANGILYINGIFKQEWDLTAYGGDFSGGDLNIGRRTNSWNGSLSNPKIYNRALSTEEIELLYIRGR